MYSFNTLVTPHPLNPPLLKGEGEGINKRGFASLGLSILWGCLRGALAPLYKIFPLSPPGDGVNATEKRNMIICVTNLSELAQIRLLIIPEK